MRGAQPAGAGPEPGPGGYADVNGLRMYYEVHGKGKPLVLLHGALSTIGTSFGATAPRLATTRMVIAVEQQGHGRTADGPRPLSVRGMADDTAALLARLGVGHADFFGYSMGAAIAVELAIRRPELVRRLVLASVSVSKAGLDPGILEVIETVEPEALAGSPFEQDYLRIAPDPGGWAALVAKNAELDRQLPEIDPEVVRSIRAPALIIIGDSDIIMPEHAVQMFRLFGGGAVGDVAGLPDSQLAILPGTSHQMVASRADLLAVMIPQFLDAPAGRARRPPG